MKYLHVDRMMNESTDAFSSRSSKDTAAARDTEAEHPPAIDLPVNDVTGIVRIRVRFLSSFKDAVKTGSDALFSRTGVVLILLPTGCRLVLHT